MADGTLKVGQITTSSGSGTITIGQSGETVDMSNVTQTGVGGDNKPAFSARLNSTQSLSDATWTKISVATEVLDSNSTYNNSSYRWTPASTGYYLINAAVSVANAYDNNNLVDNYGAIYKNGSIFIISQEYGNTSSRPSWATHNINAIINVTSASDYYELWTYVDVAGGTPTIVGNANNFFTYWSAIKIIL